MAEMSLRRLRERIVETSSHRLVRALQRELDGDLRRTIEGVLCTRLLDAVIPVLVSHYRLIRCDAEEIAMDAVLEVISDPQRYRPDRGASVETFAKRIAVCDAINRQRKADRSGVQMVSLSDAAEAELPALADLESGMGEPVHRDGDTADGATDRFSEVYRSLPPRVQQILQLRADDVEYRDIAEFTDMTSGAAMTAFSRAKQRLAEALD